MGINDDWDLLNSVYCIGGTFEQWDATDGETAQAALSTVKKMEIGQMVLDLALESVWTAFRREIVPVFWRTVCQPAGSQDTDTTLLTRFHDALQLLQNSVVVLAPLIQRCEEVCRVCSVKYTRIASIDSKADSGGGGLEQAVMMQLRATLHSEMPASAPRTMKAIYAVAFRIYVQLQMSQYKLSEDDSMMDASITGGGDCAGCRRQALDCHCQELINTFQDINRLTWSVGVAYELCSAVAAGQLVTAVQERVAAACTLPHDQYRLHALQKWLKAAALGWLSVVGAPSSPPPSTSDPLYRSCHALLIRTFLHTRIKNLFTIVIDYPESRPAVEDLRSCLQHVDVHRHLVETLRNSIKCRMLHPGVKTVNVLHAYISIIKALRVLEPRGVILDVVTEPVRCYLRSRRDFVRYIVTSLTDGGSFELSDDLIDGGELTVDDPEASTGATTEDEWRQWAPDTIYAKAKPKKCSESSSNDLISMLVDIYGSKDMFISEYRALFADRLLTNLDWSKSTVEIETKHLEQIKKRFGTNSPYISKIEVMIRDMNVSRSVNSAVLEHYSSQDQPPPVIVACMIVSGLFWPAFKEESIQLPERALGYIKQYDELFAKHKPNNKLSWKPHLGQVELELELAHKKLELKVSPGQATVIMIFEDKPRLTLQEVTLETKTTPSTARKLIAFWVGQGVLREVSPDVFEVCEDGAGGCGGSSVGPPLVAPPPAPIEDEAESAMAPSEVQRDEELQVLWSYILGMLTNLDSLPLERIHAMLKMFVEESVEFSMDELRVLLDQKVMQHKLIMVNSQYKLNKMT